MTEIHADFRSDTVTRPGPAMREAMATAEVGDDVYGEDPTVNRLESTLAEQAGMEAGLFCPSGTQSNLLALLAHCERGDEYIVGQDAHTYQLEGGGAAVLGSIQPQPIEFEADGSLNLDTVVSKIKPDDSHFARTRLLCLENTRGGMVLPLEYQVAARQLTREHGLALHLDGARAFNAAVALQVPLEEITGNYDSVSLCLSKGLGAPVGSVLCGSRDLIKSARRWRKVVGGGMRQAGILAAACLYALEHNVERLAEDHQNARRLAQGLAEIPGIHCDQAVVQTNIVYLDLDSSELADGLRTELGRAGFLIGDGRSIRLVTHLDISGAAVEQLLAAVARLLT
ncbi:MAG: low-specificity L-threonine aldolase [Gammaproteobacteria bacterium]|nr:low-specificity L-threonine aldolase [Gammaproteobacteria bacterium]